ncbi:MAG: M14 family zinc carboxypeptidase [Flavobacteriaceae bacterium]
MIKGRYIPPQLVEDFIGGLPESVSREVVGSSVLGLPIHLLKLGTGTTKIFMWSQMHGNESTTTKALVDLIPWFLDPKQANFQDFFTLYIIPQLNPDGSKAYTRQNANEIDLNRDAINRTQPESKVLRTYYDRIQPDWCLNLHGQRTVFAAGSMGETASLSFLAPSADTQRTITPARAQAMRMIIALFNELKKDLPNRIGRYDDGFNPNCVGDMFTMLNTPTILFEAGHIPNDYIREEARKYILKAFKVFLKTLLTNSKPSSIKPYFQIPENTKDYVDLMVSNVAIGNKDNCIKNQQIAIQYREELVRDQVEFIPYIVDFGVDLKIRSHRSFILPNHLGQIPLELEKNKTIKHPKFNALFSLKTKKIK